MSDVDFTDKPNRSKAVRRVKIDDRASLLNEFTGDHGSYGTSGIQGPAGVAGSASNFLVTQNAFDFTTTNNLATGSTNYMASTLING